MKTNELSITVGELLFEFESFNSWVNHAQRIWKLHEVRSEDTVVIDTKGRLIKKGKEFMRARDENSFPVKVYRALIDS